jgi:multisubunit Na+/H+ antiporter MnhB subunit
MKKLDISILIIYIAALVVLSFFWGCHYDPIVTVFGAIIAAVSALATYVQYKKMKELSNEEV